MSDRLITNLNDEKSMRSKLSASLFEVCRHKPFDKVTVGDIVTECGVSRKTFYNNFENIDALVEWILQGEATRAKSLFAHGATKEEATRKVIDWFEFYHDNRDFARNILNNDRDGNNRKLLYAAIMDDLVFQIGQCLGSEEDIPEDLMDHIRFYANGILHSVIQYVGNGAFSEKSVEYVGTLVADAMSIPLQKAYGWI